MRVSFFFGLVIAIIAPLIGCLLKDYNITFKITGIVSVSYIVICGILNGSFISGDRFICLHRFVRRYLKYRGTQRPDITEGCLEKIDINIVKYILFDYPNKKNERQKLFNESKKDKKM